MDREVCSLVLRRWEVVESLCDETKDKRSLIEDLDCSRSTVDRAVRELEATGVLEYVDGEYAVTPIGRIITDGIDEVMTTVDLRLEFEPFLEWIPDGAFDLDLTHLRDAELWLPKSGDPYAMINRHVRVVGQADTHRCVLPLVGLHGHEAAHERIVNNGATGEIIVSPEASDTLRSDPAYAELTEEMAATGRFRMLQYDGQIPYFVGIFDDVVQIGVDEDGEPRALLETDSDEVRNWAQNEFQAYKNRAEYVPVTTEATRSRL